MKKVFFLCGLIVFGLLLLMLSPFVKAYNDELVEIRIQNDKFDYTKYYTANNTQDGYITYLKRVGPGYPPVYNCYNNFDYGNVKYQTTKIFGLNYISDIRTYYSFDLRNINSSINHSYYLNFYAFIEYYSSFSSNVLRIWLYHGNNTIGTELDIGDWGTIYNYSEVYDCNLTPDDYGFNNINPKKINPGEYNESGFLVSIPTHYILRIPSENVTLGENYSVCLRTSSPTWGGAVATLQTNESIYKPYLLVTNTTDVLNLNWTGFDSNTTYLYYIDGLPFANRITNSTGVLSFNITRSQTIGILKDGSIIISTSSQPSKIVYASGGFIIGGVITFVVLTFFVEKRKRNNHTIK